MSETCVLSTLVLSCESDSSSNGGPHHLSWRSHTLQVACFFHFHLHKLSYPSSFLSFPLCHFTLIIFFYALSFPQSIVIFTYLLFSFFPLKVNLHTYLTTWLSSCPVGIFPRSHTIIAKIQIINKVSPLKWTTLKSTHIRAWLGKEAF